MAYLLIGLVLIFLNDISIFKPDFFGDSLFNHRWDSFLIGCRVGDDLNVVDISFRVV